MDAVLLLMPMLLWNAASKQAALEMQDIPLTMRHLAGRRTCYSYEFGTWHVAPSADYSYGMAHHDSVWCDVLRRMN